MIVRNTTESMLRFNYQGVKFEVAPGGETEVPDEHAYVVLQRATELGLEVESPEGTFTPPPLEPTVFKPPGELEIIQPVTGEPIPADAFSEQPVPEEEPPVEGEEPAPTEEPPPAEPAPAPAEPSPTP